MGRLPMYHVFSKVAFSEQAAVGVAARVLLVAFVKITGCVQRRQICFEHLILH
jgi:hypothetical protein